MKNVYWKVPYPESKSMHIEVTNTNMTCLMDISINRFSQNPHSVVEYTFTNMSEFRWIERMNTSFVQIVISVDRDCSTSTVLFKIKPIMAQYENFNLDDSVVYYNGSR